jgi:hypothetical protein
MHEQIAGKCENAFSAFPGQLPVPTDEKSGNAEGLGRRIRTVFSPHQLPFLYNNVYNYTLLITVYGH